MLKKACLGFLALSFLLCACGRTEKPEPTPEPTIDPYAGMVEVASGYGTTMWIKEYEELRVNPYLDVDWQTVIGERFQGGIDVSEHQKDIDWDVLTEESDLSFAILRIGYRGYGEEGRLCEDSMFRANLEGALRNNVPLGVYFFSQALSPEEAVEEAEFVLGLLADCGVAELSLPVFFDWEDISNDTARTDDMDMSILTDCAIAFCERIREAGYTPGVYAYRYPAYFNYDLTRLEDYALWIGALGDASDFYYAHEFWQCAVRDGIPGVEGLVDLNIRFPKIEPVSPEETE